MDDIKSLQFKINSLNQELETYRASAEKERDKLIRNRKKELDELKKTTKEAIENHDKETQNKYEKLLNDYQNSITLDVNNELSQMTSDYKNLLVKVKETEELLDKESKKLEKAIEELRNDVSHKDQISKTQAENYFRDSQKVYRQIKLKPHEKFMPNRLDVYSGSVKDGYNLYTAGLYEASAAVAISNVSGLKRLGIAIDDKEKEWENLFDIFKLKTEYLSDIINREIKDWEKYFSESIKTNDDKKSVINFWYKGDFDSIIQTRKKHNRYISDFSVLGKEEYLKQPASISIEDLKKCIDETDSILKSFPNNSKMAEKRYTAYCQRYDWGKKIIEFLITEINLLWDENNTGFKQASQEIKVSKDFSDFIKTEFNSYDFTEDIRDWLKIVFKNMSGEHIYIYILPEETKENVENQIIFHIDYIGPEQELYSRDISSHIREAIQENEYNYIQYTSDINELIASSVKIYKETGKDLEIAKQNIR